MNNWALLFVTACLLCAWVLSQLTIANLKETITDQQRHIAILEVKCK